MKDWRVWYKCDPAKATTCKKRSCKQNKNAKYQMCESTTRKEWAVLDATGNPVVNEETMQAQQKYFEQAYGKKWAALDAAGNPVLEGEQP